MILKLMFFKYFVAMMRIFGVDDVDFVVFLLILQPESEIRRL